MCKFLSKPFKSHAFCMRPTHSGFVFGQILMKGRITYYCAIIEDWIIPFAVYTTAETPNAFQWTGQSWRDRSLLSNTWFLGTTQVSRPPPTGHQSASRSFQTFLQNSWIWPKDRHTDHTTLSVAIGHIELLLLVNILLYIKLFINYFQYWCIWIIEMKNQGIVT